MHSQKLIEYFKSHQNTTLRSIKYTLIFFQMFQNMYDLIQNIRNDTE